MNEAIHIFMGSMNIVGKSGVGKAVLHQKEHLAHQGINANAKGFFGSDIIHFNTVFPDSLIAAFVARLIGKKVIYYGHTTMEDFKNSFKGSNLVAPLFKQWIRLCYKQAHVIITPTEYSKSLLDSYNLKRPVVALSNGIDLDYWGRDNNDRAHFRAKYNISQDAKVVVSVGHYIERKGIIEFVELAKAMPDVEFYWFGYTNLALVPSQIADAIKSAPENLKFPGYITSEELREAYHGSDAFCFMSHEETEGIVVLEALASGTPTIVRDIGVYDGWLFDGKNALKCNDNHEFKSALEHVLTSDCKSLTEGGLATARERSYDAIGAKLLTIYNM